MTATRLAAVLAALSAFLSLASAHLVLSYPGWRGNNLHTNGTIEGSSGEIAVPPGSLGMNWDRRLGQYTFPYGQQWIYPCGGMPTSQNRTKWPVMGGGAVAFQPGWFPGHSFALLYVNMGYGTEPRNMSHPMMPVFQLVGPSNEMYEGTVCLPNVPLPSGFKPEVGDNATIQVIETAQHGAALYGCVDITFAEPEDVEEVNRENCFNTTNFGFNLIFSTSDLNSAASVRALSSGMLAVVVAVGVMLL